MWTSTTEKTRLLAGTVVVMGLLTVSSLPTGAAGYDGSDLRIIGGFEALQQATMHQVGFESRHIFG